MDLEQHQSVPGSGASDTLAEVVRRRAGDRRVGLKFEGDSWSWAEVETEMQTRSAFLLGQLGAGPPHVGVLLDNVPEFLFLIGGAALAGCVIVGINPTRRGTELGRDIRHADCQLIITGSGYAPLLDGVDVGDAAGHVFVTDSSAYGAALAPYGAAATPPPPAPGDLFMLIFTSGSTGAPKAVRLTQGRAARAATGQMGFGPDDVLYCSMPIFHGNALMSIVFPALASGASLVLKRKFSASGFLPDVRDHHCTFTSTVGRALAYILATPPTDHDKDHSLKFVLAPESSTADMEAFTRRFGPPVFGGYGSSENAIVMIPHPGHPPDALGVPAPGLDIAIVDPGTERECPRAKFDGAGKLMNGDEAIGEIVGRNAVDRFEGYYNNDAAARERTRSGWYWSGDLAYRDDDDVFYFAGRTLDWIRVDGENFAAAPVERVLRRFPGLTGVAVFGVPDDTTADDQVMAVLEQPDPRSFDPVAFDAFLDEQRDLGTKWSPRYVRVVGSLPVTATNKIDKAPLRRAGWMTTGTDPVFWRSRPRSPLREIDATDRSEIFRRFEVNGRSRRLQP
ncbi:MAG: AMP-binding protein [Acidimicrobiales bacterium]